jgi:hypothetical protein
LKLRGPLHPNAVPERVWQNVSVDLITKLPVSNGYDSTAVIVDQLGKGMQVVPCTEHLGREEMAHIYRDQVWKDFGLPEW